MSEMKVDSTQDYSPIGDPYATGPQIPVPFTQREALRKLRSEKERRETFKGWTQNAVHYKELARAGFIYNGIRDRTQCVFCLGQMESWEAKDDPVKEHARLEPGCPFVQGKPVGNIPYGERDVDWEITPLDGFGLDVTGRCQEPDAGHATSGEIPISIPQFPEVVARNRPSDPRIRPGDVKKPPQGDLETGNTGMAVIACTNPTGYTVMEASVPDRANYAPCPILGHTVQWDFENFPQNIAGAKGKQL
jgi:hypothetical protein